MTIEVTEDEKLDIDDIGTILKSSRLKSKKSLEDISSELCIRKIYLTAIEEGDYETLPPIPYGIGYVRTYAQYLGLSPERAVKLYKAASLKEEQEKIEEEVSEPEVNNSNRNHVLIGILILISIYSLLNCCNHLRSDKKDIEIKEDVVVSTEVVEKTAQEVVADENKAEPEKVEEEVATPSKEDIVDTNEAQEKKAVSKPVANEENIVLSFTGESWVEIKDKNKVYVQGVFHNGDTKEIKYVKNMFISVGRPKNIKIFVKGVEKNILAKKRKSNIPLDSLR